VDRFDLLAEGTDQVGMDAIDGKQARRTGMASALGEMFDHGCGMSNP
jgi:hypothetical protein